MAIDTQKLALYLVTDPDLCAPFGLIETVKAAVAGGVSIVQLRDKHASTAQIIQNAMALPPILATHNIPLIINDDVEQTYEPGKVAENIQLKMSGLYQFHFNTFEMNKWLTELANQNNIELIDDEIKEVSIGSYPNFWNDLEKLINYQ